MAIPEDIRTERQHLVATLREAGPDAPTLAGEWRARELASHVAAQDRFLGVPAWLARSVVRVAQRRLSTVYLDRPALAVLVNGHTRRWCDSLEILDRPPPAAVVRTGVAAITLWEHFVHHEDVRRPNAIERATTPDLLPILDWIIRYNRRQLGRRVRIETPHLTRDIGREKPTMRVRGTSAEVVMWLSGRSADVEIDARAEEVAALRRRLRI